MFYVDQAIAPYCYGNKKIYMSKGWETVCKNCGFRGFCYKKSKNDS